MIRKGCLIVFISLTLLGVYSAYKIYKVVRPVIYEKFNRIDVFDPEKKLTEEFDVIPSSSQKDSILFYYSNKIKKIKDSSTKDSIIRSFNRTFDVFIKDNYLSKEELNDLTNLLRNLSK